MNKTNYSANITMQKFQQEFVYNNIVMLTLSITYPWISLSDNHIAQNRINNQISMQVNEFYRHASNTLYRQAIKTYRYSQANDFPFHAYEAVMEYTVTYNENCFLSLYNDKYEFTGGAHGNTIRSSYTWELVNGTQISLYYFFKPGTDYRRLLTEEIIKQADKNMQQNTLIYFDDYKALIVKYFNPESYYLTPWGICIYYQQYEIAPYVTGIVVFKIPYETIGWHPSC